MLNIQRMESKPGLLKGRIEGRYWTQPRGRAGTLEPPRFQQRQPPFPPDAGAQSTEEKDALSILLASEKIRNRRFEKSTIARANDLGPITAQPHLAGFINLSSCRCNHSRKEPLWLNRVSMERAGQRTAHASASEWRARERSGSTRKSP
jgi:hypothetical protein